MLKNFVLLALAQSALAWSSYYYNDHNHYDYSNTVTYTGIAWGITDDGIYAMIPVSMCEHGCAINQVCGTEAQCAISKIAMIIGLSIFGLCCCGFLCCFCCVCCKTKRHQDAYQNAVEKDHGGYHHNHSNQATGATVYTTYYA